MKQGEPDKLLRIICLRVYHVWGAPFGGRQWKAKGNAVTLVSLARPSPDSLWWVGVRGHYPPFPFKRGAIGVVVHFYIIIIGNFTAYHDQLETNLLQLFAHPVNSDGSLLLFSTLLLNRNKFPLPLTFFYCPTAAPAYLVWAQRFSTAWSLRHITVQVSLRGERLLGVSRAVMECGNGNIGIAGKLDIEDSDINTIRKKALSCVPLSTKRSKRLAPVLRSLPSSWWPACAIKYCFIFEKILSRKNFMANEVNFTNEVFPIKFIYMLHVRFSYCSIYLKLFVSSMICYFAFSQWRLMPFIIIFDIYFKLWPLLWMRKLQNACHDWSISWRWLCISHLSVCLDKYIGYKSRM